MKLLSKSHVGCCFFHVFSPVPPFRSMAFAVGVALQREDQVLEGLEPGVAHHQMHLLERSGWGLVDYPD